MILVEKMDRAGLVRINRPDALNALNSEVMADLIRAHSELDEDNEIGAIVITDSDRAFAAGADIKEMVEKSSVEMWKDDNIRHWDRIQDI